MATLDFSTYTTLQQSIADTLGRTDLSTVIPGLITLAEAVIARDVQRKTIRAQIDISNESTTLPTDCAELRSIYPLTDRAYQDVPLTIGPPEALADARARACGVPGRPQVASVIDGKIVVAPEPDQAYTYQITYFQKLVPLSASNPTNSVFAEAPDIYFYGALAESAPYLQHDERLQMWENERDSRIASLQAKRQREELNASIKKARLPRVF